MTFKFASEPRLMLPIVGARANTDDDHTQRRDDAGVVVVNRASNTT
jgi:hypothetical protein